MKNKKSIATLLSLSILILPVININAMKKTNPQIKNTTNILNTKINKNNPIIPTIKAKNVKKPVIFTNDALIKKFNLKLDQNNKKQNKINEFQLPKNIQISTQKKPINKNLNSYNCEILNKERKKINLQPFFDVYFKNKYNLDFKKIRIKKKKENLEKERIKKIIENDFKNLKLTKTLMNYENKKQRLEDTYKKLESQNNYNNEKNNKIEKICKEVNKDYKKALGIKKKIEEMDQDEREHFEELINFIKKNNDKTHPTQSYKIKKELYKHDNPFKSLINEQKVSIKNFKSNDIDTKKLNKNNDINLQNSENSLEINLEENKDEPIIKLRDSAIVSSDLEKSIKKENRANRNAVNVKVPINNFHEQEKKQQNKSEEEEEEIEEEEIEEEEIEEEIEEEVEEEKSKDSKKKIDKEIDEKIQKLKDLESIDSEEEEILKRNQSEKLIDTEENETIILENDPSYIFDPDEENKKRKKTEEYVNQNEIKNKEIKYMNFVDLSEYLNNRLKDKIKLLDVVNRARKKLTETLIEKTYIEYIKRLRKTIKNTYKKLDEKCKLYEEMLKNQECTLEINTNKLNLKEHRNKIIRDLNCYDEQLKSIILELKLKKEELKKL